MTLMLCCNDHRNGAFLGVTESIEFQSGNGDQIELEGMPVTCSHLPDRPPKRLVGRAAGDDGLRVGRVVIPCLSYYTWVGSWCWDAARVRGVEAFAVLRYLVEKRGWQCTQGSHYLFEAINERHAVTIGEWKRFCFVERKSVR